MTEALEAAKRLRLYLSGELLIARLAGDDEEAALARRRVRDASRVCQALERVNA